MVADTKLIKNLRTLLNCSSSLKINGLTSEAHNKNSFKICHCVVANVLIPYWYNVISRKMF